MSTTAPHAPGPARRHAWLRVLVLLLALSVPGAHAQALPTSPAVAENGSAVFEYDVLDTVLRPVTRGSGRPALPLRPSPFPVSPPGPAARLLPLPVPPRAPHALHALRSVVLRC